MSYTKKGAKMGIYLRTTTRCPEYYGRNSRRKRRGCTKES
jgi:hypothetical protein